MHKGIYAAVGMAAAIVVPGTVLAGMDFGRVAPLASTAATDVPSAIDLDPSIATDGNGVWIAAWESHDPGLGITNSGAPAYSRSLDDGATWSPPALIRPEAADDSAAKPSVATDGQGKWIIAWGASPQEIVVSISVDDGLIWSVPTMLVSTMPARVHHSATIATDGSGTWIVAWHSDDSLGGTIGEDEDILFSRSTDDGATWSPAAPLNPNASSDASHDFRVRIATDRAGTWVAVWSGFARTRYSRSTDNGASWSTPIQISHVGYADPTSPDVATDGSGTWIAVWSLRDSQDRNLWFSRSTDHGATWSTESWLHSYLDIDHGGDAGARVVFSGPGSWSVVWHSTDDLRGTTGGSNVLRISTSRDGGQTWSSPAAPARRARSDDDVIDLHPAIASSSAGTSVLLWSSDDTLGGTIGTDRDILVVTAHRDCAALAREDCRVPTRARGSRLKLRDAVGGADRLNWSWRYGQQTTDSDLGNPVASDSYVLCLYEQVGGSAGLVAEWDMRAGQTSKGAPSWTQQTGEVRYEDKNLEQGSVRSLRIRTGADGNTSVRVKASGPGLALPALPLTTSPAVRIQLVNLATSICWDGAHDQATKNDASQYKSVSD